MAPRYERVRSEDDDDRDQREEAAASSSSQQNGQNAPLLPSSPPPSFHSVEDRQHDQHLASSFDPPSDDEEEDRDTRVRAQNGGSGSGSGATHSKFSAIPFVGRLMGRGGGNSSSEPKRSNRLIVGNDAVFSNIPAKPVVEKEVVEELPPTYEQAAADATPPYWETTILAPGMSPDEVFIDGLPVGSMFAFVWNAMISMSFQLVGFLLTYLLHTTHAAKNGSKAGLGVTLIQYGFYIHGPNAPPMSTPPPSESKPSNPNDTNFNQGQMDRAADSIGRQEWLSYALMIVGWFILIRSVSDFIRARRMEQLVLASPGGATVTVVEGESAERAV